MFSQPWSYLIRVKVFQVASLITHLGEPPHSKWRVHAISIFISFLSFIFSFISITPCFVGFMFLSFFHFLFGHLHFNCFLLCSFIFRKASSSSPYLVLSFLPLEVNLQTYLTTWLSSCSVGIFPRSHPIIAKTQIINKVSPLKWKNLKSTHTRISTELPLSINVFMMVNLSISTDITIGSSCR